MFGFRTLSCKRSRWFSCSFCQIFVWISWRGINEGGKTTRIFFRSYLMSSNFVLASNDLIAILSSYLARSSLKDVGLWQSWLGPFRLIKNVDSFTDCWRERLSAFDSVWLCVHELERRVVVGKGKWRTTPARTRVRKREKEGRRVRGDSHTKSRKRALSFEVERYKREEERVWLLAILVIGSLRCVVKALYWVGRDSKYVNN